MTKHYGPRLKALHFRNDQAITDALSEMELTSAQGQILGFLALRPEPPCPRDLEDAFHLSHPTVSGLLNRLEKKEFICLRPDQQDRRCKRIFLLPRGEACCQRMYQTIQSIEAQMVQGFTEAERESFSRLLDRAIQNMGGHCCRPVHKEEP